MTNDSIAATARTLAAVAHALAAHASGAGTLTAEAADALDHDLFAASQAAGDALAAISEAETLAVTNSFDAIVAAERLR